MATQEQLEAALRNAAVKARQGDERAAMAARRFAAELKALRAGGSAAPPTAPRAADDPSLWEGGRVPSVDPTEGMSGGQLFGAGAGKSVRDSIYGAIQSAGDGGIVGSAVRSGFGALGVDVPESPISRWARDKVADNAESDQQLMGTGAGITGNIGGQIAQMLIPGAGMTRAGMAAAGVPRLALGAGEAGTFASVQPVAEAEDRLVNTAAGAAGGAVGQKLGDKVGGVISRAAAPIADDAARLMARAREAGIKIGVPELTQNPGLRTVLDQMARLPFAGARSRTQQNNEAFNRAVSRTFGEDVPAINATAFAAAQKRIGAEFDRLTESAQLPATPQLVQSLSAVADEARRLGTGDIGQKVANWAEDLISKADANGVIPGRAYQSFDSKIGELTKAGGETGFYLGKLRDTVRAAMDETVEGVDKAAWNQARREYANLMTIAPLVAKESGEGISPQALMGRVTADGAGKRRMASGRGGDLGELAQIGSRFLRKAPDSGSADRALVNLGVLGSLGGAQQLGLIDPGTAVVAGGVLAGNRGLLKLLGSNAAGRASTAPLPQLPASALARLAQASPYALGAATPTALAQLVSDPEAQAKELERRRRQGGR